MLDTRREPPTGMFLEDFVDAMEAVPLRVRRDQRVIKELDLIATKKQQQAEVLQRSLFAKLRARQKPSAAASTPEELSALRVQAMHVEALHQETLAHADEKCATTHTSLALVGSHIGALEADLATLESELRAKGMFDDGGELAPGDEVAARVNARENLWIHCVVARYVLATDHYEVCDIENRAQRYSLPIEQVVQVPKTDSGANCASRGISKGHRIIALYPDTTSFYLATVTSVPRGRGGPLGPANALVMVQFDDDHDETGQIPERAAAAKYVLEPPAEDVEFY